MKISAQPPPEAAVDVAKLEAEASASKAKLADASLKDQDREKVFNEIAYELNAIAEAKFGKGEYEAATKLFVEADGFVKQYHESYLARMKVQLADAEAKLVEYDKEPNAFKHDTMYKVGRILVSTLLSEVIKETRSLGDEAATKTYLERYGDVAREVKSANDEAESYEKIGEIELNAGNSQKAFELYDKALALRNNDKTSSKADEKGWWTTDYIAFAHWNLGEYNKAAEKFTEEIESLRKLESDDAEFKPNISPEWKLDEKEAAEMIQLQKTSALGDKLVVRSSLAAALFNVARIRILQGNYGSANETLGEVEKLLERMRAVKNETKEDWILAMTDLSVASHQAMALMIRGRIGEAQGNEAEAVKNYNDSVALYSQLSGGKPSGAIAALRVRLATLYAAQNKFDDARAQVRDAMRIRARLHQESGTTYALFQASRIELAAKNADAALKFARQAKASALALSAEDTIAEAGEVEADALLLKNADNKNSLALEQATVGYKSAIEVYRQAELRPLLARALNSLGAAYERAGKAKEAEAAYKEAVQTVESIRTSFGDAAQSEGFSNRRDVTAIYQHLVDLLVAQGRAEEALQYATRAQRRDLIANVPKTEIKLEGKAADALKQVAEAERRETAAVAKLEKTRTDPTGGTGAAGQQKNLTNAIGAARQDYALAIKRLEIEQPNLRFTVRPTDLLKLQSTIASDEALVSYLVTPDKLFVFVVRKTAVAVRSVEISQNDLRALVAEAREGLDNFANDFYQLSADADTGFNEEKARPDLRVDDKSAYYKKNLAPLKNALVELHEKLIAPIDDLIKDAKTLKIIPNADLFLLPFAALVAPDNVYLLEKHDLVFMTAGDLITAPQKPSSGSLVAFGDPTEAGLDGALEEVRAIEKVFPRSTLYTEDKATKEQLFKLTSAKILHFATHGNIRTPLEDSNIQMARLPNLLKPDLSYGEIYALPIEQTDMIVLSACQTALGTVSGTEIGVFIEAFRTKTATVAASLWSVDDIATRTLMVEFYKNLAAGQTRAFAMRTAQLKLLRDPRTKNPLFWAAFVLYGDGGKLSGMTAAPAKKALGK